MSKNKKDLPVTPNSNQAEFLITSQFRHIKELSELKYEAEEKREQNLIQQSSQMQTVFSFMTAAIFMAVPICIEHRGNLSLEFFLVSVSVIVVFLIASLTLASLAQWRWKTETFRRLLRTTEESDAGVCLSPAHSPHLARRTYQRTGYHFQASLETYHQSHRG